MECSSLARIDVSFLNEGDSALAKLFVKVLCSRVSREDEFAEAIETLESNMESIDGDRLSELSMVICIRTCVVHPLPCALW
jgi:hypothetical protein